MKFSLFLMVSASIFLGACSGSNSTNNEANNKAESTTVKQIDPMSNIGIGPIKELTLPAEIDQNLASKGKEIYDAKCTACHKPTEKFIGPAPKGIFERRNPVWVMNMILNPDKMILADPVAKKLLMEFNGAPMANQNLTQEEARAVLEYFRTL